MAFCNSESIRRIRGFVYVVQLGEVMTSIAWHAEHKSLDSLYDASHLCKDTARTHANPRGIVHPFDLRPSVGASTAPCASLRVQL